MTATRMVALSGGAFRAGDDRFYPEEAPVSEAWVAAFEIDEHPVTNRQFADFVDATGYLTVAERPLDPAGFAAGARVDLQPGSLVFVPTSGPVPLSDWRQWWRWVPGASWRHPQGPGSGLDGKAEHPVVQVSFDDAQAYAAWAGKRLPTEEEWEFAARGGLEGATYAWGDDPNHAGAYANTWQGRFPYLNNGARGWVGTSPVGAFPANGFGLVDMSGNTWEWTTSYWTDSRRDPAASCACGTDDARSASRAPGEVVPRRVLKGGSHLCAPEYCLRYRPAARSAQAEDSATTHIGFRCVRSLA